MHSEEEGEEALLTHSSVKEPFSPGRAAAGSRPSLAPGEEWLLRISPPQNSVIGGRMHSEEEGEEALLTRFLPWAKSPPARLGDLDFELFSCPGQLNSE